MQKIFAISLIASALSFPGLAQNDTTKWEYLDDYKPSRITLLKDQVFGMQYQEGKFRGNWAGIFVGFSGLANADYSDYPESQQDFLDLRFLNSNVINLNLIEISAGLQKVGNTMGIVTGLGMEINTWRLDKNVTIEKRNSIIEPVDVAAEYGEPLKSRFVSTWLSVPVLFEFQFPAKRNRNRFYASTGIILNARLASHAKIKFRDDDGQRRKLKTPGNFYMQELRYSATLRMGYRWVNLFATYDLSPLFKENKGPEVFPWSVGIALISF